MPIPAEDWNADVREMLIFMMVRQMGMEYGRAFTLAIGPSCTPAMAFTYSRLARERYGDETAFRNLPAACLS